MDANRSLELLEVFKLLQSAKGVRRLAAALCWRDPDYAAQLTRDIYRPTVAAAWLHFWRAFPPRR